VAVGAVAASNGIPLAATLAAFLHSLASQLISAAIRLGVTGQRQGVALLSRLEDVLAELAENAAHSSLDDLGGAALIADQMSLRHEIQHSRLFLS
jgi:urease accessory protein